MNKDKMKIALLTMLIAIILWVGITSIIYSFTNPSKTQTEAFFHIPQSMMLNFKEGN